MNNEAKPGLRGEQGGNVKRCIAMHFWCVCFANLWSQKKWRLFFLHNRIDNQSKFCFQKCIQIFSVGVCILETSADVFPNITKRYLIVTCQCKQHSVDMQLRRSTIFKNFSNKPKMLQHILDILSTIPTKLVRMMFSIAAFFQVNMLYTQSLPFSIHCIFCS